MDFAVDTKKSSNLYVHVVWSLLSFFIIDNNPKPNCESLRVLLLIQNREVNGFTDQNIIEIKIFKGLLLFIR